MDQIQIGKFIATMRKENNMTQKQLAEKLSVSDKTISKWECGKGLPEVSLLLPLCEALHISVNDLLSGEKITDHNYQKKAEENMMHLLKENEENKKIFILSLLLAFITIIAVCSLVVIASYIEMKESIRVILILFASLLAILGMEGAGVLELKAGYFECLHCHHLFTPTFKDYIKGYHNFTSRYLTCPKCGKNSMCKHRIVRN